MHSSTFVLALASSAHAPSFLKKRQEATGPDLTQSHLAAVCLPGNATDGPDYNAPCNALQSTTFLCGYGPEYNLSSLQDGYGVSEDIHPQSPAAQRDCACQSQLFDSLVGCLDCYTAHGDPELGRGDLEGRVASASSLYCAASSTPTEDLALVLFSLAPSDTATATSSYSDPIGNQTAVSFYYTPSVSGSAAYVPTQPTAANGSVTFTSLNTVSGQIVATGTAEQSEGSSSSSSGSPSASTGGSAKSTTSEGSAMETAVLRLGGVGMLGFAAAMAML